MLWGGCFGCSKTDSSISARTITHPETHDQLVQPCSPRFSPRLMLMLVFSAGIILYGSLFRSPETAVLLTLPARTERVFLHKFQEAVLFSSWGFLLLGSPMLLAYGIVGQGAVVLLCDAAAVPGGLHLHSRGHRGDPLPVDRATILPTTAAGCWRSSAALLCSAAGHGIAWSAVRTARKANCSRPRWFQELLGRLQFTEQRLLPSWWLSSGLLEAAARRVVRGLVVPGLMISNALFFRQLAIWTAGRIYRAAYSGLLRQRAADQTRRPALVDRAVLLGIGSSSPGRCD